MKKFLLVVCALGALLAGGTGISLGQEKADETKEKQPEAKKEGLVEEGATQEGVRILNPKRNAIFALIPDAKLTNLEGKEVELYSFGKDKPLVIFTANSTCPMCKKLAPAMVATMKQFKGKVDFIILNPTDYDSKSAKESKAKYGFEAPYFLDTGAKYATKLNIKTTTEAFLIDTDRRIRYRGAVDDQYGIGIDKAKADNNYLNDAITSLLAKEDIKIEATWAPGCVLDLDKPVIERKDAPTWFGVVEPIVQENCLRCHRKGEAAPFELATYEDAKSHAAMIRRVVRQRRMPPWFANPHVGDEFKNDARLSDADRQTIIDWVDTGAKKGSAKLARKAPSFVEGWTIGKPDSKIQAGKTFSVPARGAIPYRNEWVTTTEKEDRWVNAYEIRSSEPIVVHHVLVFIRYPNGHPRKSEEPKAFEGLTGAFAGMVPGQKAVTFPQGMGKYLPKGAKLRFQIHYTAVGEKLDCDIWLGLKFTDGKPEREVRTGAVFNYTFQIPPGAKRHEVQAKTRVRKPMRILGYLPHMHLRGAAFTYNAKYPNGKSEVLLDVPQYDFNWQLAYFLKEHKYIPRGTQLSATAWFDNSADNKANPNPKATVRFGEQTWNEMMIGYYDYYYVRDENDKPAEKSASKDKEESARNDAPEKE